MKTIKCWRCGFPLWFAMTIRWNENGTISQRMRPGNRAVIVESEIFNEVFSCIEEKIGVSLSHLVFEAQRNASREVIDAMLAKYPFKAGKWGPLKQPAVHFFCRLASVTGQSYARPLYYKPGREGEAVVRNPYNRELMAAVILGAFESLEGKPFRHSWKRIDGDDVIHIEAARAKPEISGRMEVTLLPTREGSLRLDRCPVCKVPRDLWYLQWREEEGEILDKRRGVRLTFLDGYTPNVVFRELERELGEAVPPLIINAQKKAVLRHIEDLGLAERGRFSSEEGRTEFYREMLDNLPLWGQGYAEEWSHSPGRLEVEVVNPYNDYLLAGQMAGIFEAVEEREARVEWEKPDPASIRFHITAA
jgi:hypothetical protein